MRLQQLAETIGYRTLTRTAALEEPESPSPTQINAPRGASFEEVPVHEPDLMKKPLKSALKGNRAKVMQQPEKVTKRQSFTGPRQATIREEGHVFSFFFKVVGDCL